MRKWFTKFRLSAAFDAGKTIPADLEKRAARSDDLGRFVQNSIALERALKETPPQPEISPALHGSIMRAVRNAERPQVPSRPITLRWLPASAFAALALLAIWWSFQTPGRVHHSATGTEPLAVASRALEMGQEISITMPATAISSLSQEWDRLNQDMTNTANFLLASIPDMP